MGCRPNCGTEPGIGRGTGDPRPQNNIMDKQRPELEQGTNKQVNKAKWTADQAVGQSQDRQGGQRVPGHKTTKWSNKQVWTEKDRWKQAGLVGNNSSLKRINRTVFTRKER